MSSLAKQIVQAMLAKVEQYGLELMQRYPDDLCKHDFNTLSRSALPGAKFGWCVGHSHTHLAILGIHPKLNEHTTYVTNLCNDDRFYLLEVGRDGETFTLKEQDRKAFHELSRTAIPYKRIGKADAFWLYRDNVRVGTCRIEFKGNPGGRPTYHASLAVMAGTCERDKVTLEDWASQAAVELSGTLFRDLHFTWEAAIEMALAA